MSRTITSDIGATWGTWWFGDMLGALVFTPLMLTWLRGRPLGGAEPEGKTSALETVLLLSAIIGVNLFVFWSPYSIIGGVPIVYAVLFPLMWASLRFGPRGKSLAVFLTSFIAIWATVSGSGTFAQEDVRAGLMALQVFVAAVAIIFLLLASLNEERTRYRVELEKYVEKLERSLQKNRILQSRGESAPMGGEGGETVSP